MLYFTNKVKWDNFLTLPGPGHIGGPDPLLFCIVIRWEPSPLQLRATVAATAEQRGRPGDVRLAPAPVWTILLVHP